MAVPKFEDFLYPFLLRLKDKSATKQEMKDFLVKHFKLTAEDCAIRTKGGNTTQLLDRIGWTLQYFRRALFIDMPQRGVYRITQRGKDYLSSHDSLTINDLLNYPEFAEFANRNKHTSTKTKTKAKDSPFSPIPNLVSEEITPTEQLENVHKIIKGQLADELLERVLEQSSQFFEQIVLDLLLKMGYGDPNDNSARVTPQSHDDGVDGIIPQDKLGLDKIYFQAKRYKPDNTIDRPAIQTFVGALEGKKANKGVFITTSSYTGGAREYVERTTKKIVLIDGKKLANYMIEYNVGVSIVKTYEVKRIDSDYFEN